MCMGGCEMISSWNLQHGAVSEWASIQVNQNPISHPPHFESERSKQNYEEELQSLSWTRFNFLFLHFQDSGGKEKHLFFFPSLKNKKRVQNRQKKKKKHKLCVQTTKHLLPVCVFGQTVEGVVVAGSKPGPLHWGIYSHLKGFSDCLRSDPGEPLQAIRARSHTDPSKHTSSAFPPLPSSLSLTSHFLRLDISHLIACLN